MVRSLQREGLWLAIVLLAAAGLRVAYLGERQAQPDFGHPEIDAGFHDDWARTIAFGEERSGEWRRTDRPEPLLGEPYLRPPGYPWFLAAVYALTGGSATAAVIANQVCGLLAALLAFLVARRAAGGWAGLAAAGVLSFHWATIYFEGELHAPPLLGLFELAGVYSLLRAREGGLRWAWAAGLALGAACLVRPNVLALLPVALPWLGWALRRRGAPWVRPVLAVAAGCLLAISPATLRNLRVSGEFVPITANLGINLYLGNHAGATGLISGELGELGTFRTCYDYPAVVARLEEQEGRELSLPEVSGYFGDRARAWILGDLGGFLELTLLKLRYLVGPAEIGHNKEVSLEKADSGALRHLGFPVPLLLALAVLGSLLAWRAGDEGEHSCRARRETVLLCAGLALAFTLSLLPFFAAARYRVPILPLVAPLVGMSLMGGALSWRGGVAAATLALAWLAGPEAEVARSKHHLLRAQGYFASGEHERSRGEYDLALAIMPDDPVAHYGMGVLEQSLGNAGAARSHYERALEVQPLLPKANFNLGFLLSEAGDSEGALGRWHLAAEQDPLLAAAPYQRGLLLLRLGRVGEALPELERAVERGRGSPAALAYLTDLALLLSIASDAGLRDGGRALALADEALALRDTAQVRYVRAAALAEEGRYGEAEEEARRGLAAASSAERPRFEAALASYRARKPMRM